MPDDFTRQGKSVAIQSANQTNHYRISLAH